MTKEKIKEEVKFKTNIVHKAKATPNGVYYWCNRTIGQLSMEQLRKKTNWGLGTKITCKNCIRFHKYKR